VDVNIAILSDSTLWLGESVTKGKLLQNAIKRHFTDLMQFIGKRYADPLCGEA
jgi:hypothetical protein